MPPRITAEDLRKRQERLNLRKQKLVKEAAQVHRKLIRQEEYEELVMYAALGRAVEASLHIATPEDWEVFCKQSGCLAFVQDQASGDGE